MTNIIDGKARAKEIKELLKAEVNQLTSRNIVPGLAVVLVGSDPASNVYVKSKKKTCKALGIESFSYELPENTPEQDLVALIDKLNKDKKVHGILVQLPLPRHINENEVLAKIDPKKDVDGFHPVNLGKLIRGESCLKSCTPAGIIDLLESTGETLAGKKAVIIGRSNIVGKPVSIMLLEKNTTVTICHSKTKNLEKEVSEADIVVAAIGKPNFVKGSWIKKNAIVLDVGINRMDDGTLAGDVEFEEAKKNALWITPVPGGIGPMTIAMLMKNTVEATKKQTKDQV